MQALAVLFRCQPAPPGTWRALKGTTTAVVRSVSTTKQRQGCDVNYWSLIIMQIRHALPENPYKDLSMNHGQRK